ncbi:MAG: nitroreductase family protein [Oscillospiraceae bacterium]|nr:nitroreductase family protein [Oscillospiraceae bacterium]
MTNQVLRELEERMSVRLFDCRPVSEEIKRTLFHAAFQAPTAGCQQLYTILDITDPALKRELADICDHQSFIASAPVVLIFLADCRRWLDSYREAGCQARRPGPGDLLLAMADACIAAQNTVTAAHSLGLGSCYIGDILEQCERTRDLLCLPEETVPAAMLVIGWPKETKNARTKPGRADQSYIVHENRYRLLSGQEHREMIQSTGRCQPDYDSWMSAFCRRKYESDFSREMSRSASVYLRPFLQEE